MVLSIVKCILLIADKALDILAVRQADPWPAEPVEHLRDYYGRTRDPMWDVVDSLKEENAVISDQEIP